MFNVQSQWRCLAVVRRSTSADSLQVPSADWHRDTTRSGGWCFTYSSADTSGFRQQRPGRSSSLLAAAHRLQAVVNAAARLTYHLRRSNHWRVIICIQSPLATRSRASSVQHRHFGLQSCTDLRRNTSDHSIASLICLAVDLFLWCLSSGSQLSQTFWLSRCRL